MIVQGGQADVLAQRILQPLVLYVGALELIHLIHPHDAACINWHAAQHRSQIPSLKAFCRQPDGESQTKGYQPEQRD